MSSLTLTKIRFRNGTWEGLVEQAGSSATPPGISVRHLDREIGGVTLTAGTEPESWILAIAIPPEVIGDGVQSLVIYDTARGEKLGDFTLIAGDVLADDLRAEVELLRAELDMLKRAFRRHCLETA